MRLGGMQPYFFPYLGYFALIKHTEKWVVVDNVQYIDRGWVNRNRILSPSSGNRWTYIRVPLVKASHKLNINERKIRKTENWQQKIFSQLVHYKNSAPYYDHVIDLLKRIFSYPTDSIVELNTHAIKVVCEYLNLNFDYQLSSRINLNDSRIMEPDDWPLQTALLLGADEYFNPPGGMKFYNRDKFESHQVKLKFMKVHLKPYNQDGHTFEPGLSIIDVMMFNSPDEINGMLDDYELL